MTIAEICLPLMIILIIGTVVPAKAMGRLEYDNGDPRNARFWTPGFRARSLAAHQNGWEAFGFFAAAVIVAEFRGAAQSKVDALAAAFVVARFLYVVCYLGDRPTARSIVWAVGFFLVMALFFSPVLFGR